MLIDLLLFRMPSDAKKRQQQKKKDAAKARQNKPAGTKANETNGVNGDENVPISEEGKKKTITYCRLCNILYIRLGLIVIT